MMKIKIIREYRGAGRRWFAQAMITAGIGVLSFACSIPMASADYSPDSDVGMRFHLMPNHPHTYGFDASGDIVRVGYESGADDIEFVPDTPIDVIDGALSITSSTDLHSAWDYNLPGGLYMYMYWDTYDNDAVLGGTSKSVFSARDLEGGTASAMTTWNIRYVDDTADYYQWRGYAGTVASNTYKYRSSNATPSLSNNMSVTMAQSVGGLNSRAWYGSNASYLPVFDSQNISTPISSADVFLFTDHNKNNDFTGKLKCLLITTTNISSTTIRAQLDSECAGNDYVVPNPASPTNLVQTTNYGGTDVSTIAVGKAVGAALSDPLTFQATVTSPFGEGHQVCLAIGLQKLDPEGAMTWQQSDVVYDGATAAVTIATDSLEAGNYRWVAVTRDAARCANSNEGYESAEAPSNNNSEEATDFQVVREFSPEMHGFAFANSMFDVGIDQNKIYNIFKTAFDLSDENRFPSEVEERAVSAALFPVNKFGFQGGFCSGMGKTALLRYASEAFVQNQFPDFWSALATRSQHKGPRFIGNLDGSNPDGSFLSDAEDPYSSWKAVSLDSDAVLQMVVRMQMWDTVRYGETIKRSGPKDVLTFLQGDPEFTAFGNYGISIETDPETHIGHLLVPYRVSGGAIYVYDPNEPYDPNKSEKFIYISYNGDPDIPNNWKWEYPLWQDGDYVLKEGSLTTSPIQLSEFGLAANATLPPPPPTPEPTPTPTPDP